MRYLFTLILTVLVFNYSFGQNCKLISGVKNKKTGIETKGGIVSSKDSYGLLIQKKIDPNNIGDTLNYIVSLTAASKIIFPDSVMNSEGSFVLFLENGEVATWRNISFLNNPMGLSATVGFQVRISERQIRQIINNPIKKLEVLNLLETEFAPNQQRNQKSIFSCLVNNF